ncbi:hypothetical protein [Salegentibacter sp. F14]
MRNLKVVENHFKNYEEKRSCFVKTERARLNLKNLGTGIPCNDKLKAHARVVSILAYHLVA